MGAASGGRLTFSLVALAVLMASGATGVVVVGAGPGHSPGGGKTTTKMVGASAQRSGGACRRCRTAARRPESWPCSRSGHSLSATCATL